MTENEVTCDINGRPYACFADLKIGSKVQVDDGFEGCFLPWSILDVIEVNGDLALIHNAPECGACGGDGKTYCVHFLVGNVQDNGYLIGIYPL